MTHWVNTEIEQISEEGKKTGNYLVETNTHIHLQNKNSQNTCSSKFR